MDKFTRYITLGDSMSIDLYPASEARSAGIKCRDTIGASSLLFENEDSVFPEFAGQDLKHLFPQIELTNFSFDGASTLDLLSTERYSELVGTSESTLITLTIGGNDLLHLMGKRQREKSVNFQNEVDALLERVLRIRGLIFSKFPNAFLILNTVYDPTDGTGILPTTSELFPSKLPIEYLHTFNNYVRTLSTKGFCGLADVHKHFLGHGAEAPSASDFWYWKPSPIEPGYRGASEMRRLWLACIKNIGASK